jgi:hypothetical protein
LGWGLICKDTVLQEKLKQNRPNIKQEKKSQGYFGVRLLLSVQNLPVFSLPVRHKELTIQFYTILLVVGISN